MRLATIAYPNLPESDRNCLILHRFITGLHDRRTTDILLLHPPTNLSSAIRRCRLCETHHSGNKDTPYHDRKPLRPIPPPPSKPSSLPVRFPDFNPGCAYCTAFGPQAKRCGHNTPSKSTFVAPAYLDTVSHSPPFTVPVNFESQSVQPVVDTGANVSLVNPSILSRKTYDQIEPKSYPRNLRAANGTTIPIMGRITLQFVLEGTVVAYQFLVTPNNPWNLVLGLDFLASHDCIIHTKDRRLLVNSNPAVTPPLQSLDFDYIYNAVLSATALDPISIDDILPPPTSLAPDARNQLRELLLSFPDVFTWTTDSIGRTSKVQHTINTGDAKPVWQPPRRIPTRYRDEVDKILDELLKARIIQPSSSPWASLIALVPKKDGSLRLCIDYRRLNAVTVRDSFPLPRLDDTLDTLGSGAWFSTLDLKSGYWQVEIHPKDRHKTAFTVPQGLFDFHTLPFGLCNAAATFQRLMYQVLRHLAPSKCLVYLDDIIVFGQTIDQHNRNLREVLEALRNAGLTLNPHKCVFLRSEVQFLGHKISPGHIAALPDRLQQI
ncbi:hypothetical protein SprV_0902716300 [Sparganum proliferum]